MLKYGTTEMFSMNTNSGSRPPFADFNQLDFIPARNVTRNDSRLVNRIELRHEI